MGKATITKGRDFEYTMFLVDKDDKPVDITGFSFVRLQKKKEDETLLSLLEPETTPVDEVHKIDFPVDPISGSFQLDYGNGNKTAAIQFNDNAAAVAVAINALKIFSQVQVTGAITQATGLTVTYTGNDGNRDQIEPTIAGNTLSDGVNTVIPTVTEQTKGIPTSGLTVVSAQRGEIKVKGSEDDSNSLKDGKNQVGVLEVKIGPKDLNIPAIQDLYDVEENPLL